jgi:hypothetical protein
MKQKDIATLIVIAAISAIVSFIISGKIFVTPANRQQKVEVVDVIDSSFQTPSSKYFNSSSIDPAQLVQIGSNNNQNPFNAKSQ